MSDLFLRLLRNELTIMLSNRAVIFWSLVFPVFLLTVMLFAFGSKGGLGNVPIEIVDHDHSPASARYIDTVPLVFSSGDVTITERRLSDDQAKAPTAASNVRVEVPKGFGQAAPDQPARVVVSYSFGAPIAVRTVAHAIGNFSMVFDTTRTRPNRVVDVAYTNAGGKNVEISYAQYILTGVLVMVMMSTGIMTTSVALAALRETQTIKVYACMPLPRTVFLASFLAARAIIAIASAVALLLAGHFLYGVPFKATPAGISEAALLIVLGTTMFLALGLALGARTSSIGGATMIGNLVYFPLMFLGDLTIPLKDFPTLAGKALSILPVHGVVSALRECLFTGSPPEADLMKIIVIFGWTALFFAVSIRLFRWSQPAS
ncbi:ABC transporter permease [Nguyenibacter vanlangensis]|uniref:ABC transporter permease n=1 Tax=Nguyenibacter vanlangensis TaxID=1216886 RepID=A0A7Y7M5R6_9PROT|nr:ABC transporter permease [Nguyenibacter vanlangensis]NVN09773.1 ABC transporter permease [Nguyenibacter vanlangensis]